MFRIYLRIPSIHIISKNKYCYHCTAQNISISRYGVTVSLFQLNDLSISGISIIPQYRLTSFSVTIDSVSFPSVIDLVNGTFAFQREQNDVSFLLHADHCTIFQPKLFQFEKMLAGSKPLSCTFSLSVDHFNYITPHCTIYLNSFSFLMSADQQFSGSLRQVRVNMSQTNVIEIKGISFQPESIVASSLFFYYSPSFLDALIQDVCAIIRFVPQSICLSTFYHLISLLNQWKSLQSNSSYSTFDFPLFRDDGFSIDNPKLFLSIPTCKVIFDIDVQNCSQGSNRRERGDSGDGDIHFVTLQTSLSSSISQDEWVIRMINTSIIDQNEGEIAVIRTCLLNGFIHSNISFLDIFFSGVSLSFSMSKFVTIFRIAQEVTFSVWCSLYDIMEEFCQCSMGKCNDSSCRYRNHFSLDCSWKKSSKAAQPSLRNRDYSNRREKEKLFKEWRSTPATDGHQVERIRCKDLELQSVEDHWSIQVKEWGGNHLPSIEFYFSKISFRIENNAVIDIQRITLCKRLLCESLLKEFDGAMKEAKEIWGVTTGELLQRISHCGENIECMSKYAMNSMVR